MAGRKPGTPSPRAVKKDCDHCDCKLSWEREKHFRDLVEYSKTGMFIVQDNVVVYLNPEQIRITGPFPALNAPIPFEHVHPEDRERVIDAYEKAAHGQIRDVDVDFRYLPPEEDGSEPCMKWLTCRGCLIDYKGRPALMVNMVDMTRARELEHLLDIQDKMASLGRVAAGLAHEMRNPLSGINIYLTMLKKIFESGTDMHKVLGIIAQMQDASARIEAVIRRVMDFSKPGEPRFVTTDITGPIEDAVGLASTTLRKSDIALEKHLDGNLPEARIDPHMMEQVLLNLITNAAEAMKEMTSGKRIHITSTCEKDRIVVAVSDSGPGVKPELRAKIFEPFFTTKSDSTGIGLSICQRIVTDHRGTIRVSQSAFGGAEFIVDIPACRQGAQ